MNKNVLLSSVYISFALLFGIGVWYFMGAQHASDYYSSYLIELSLSLDNLFVIALIFKYFKIPKKFHNKILFWGIFGVIILRGIMIFAGIILINYFSWVLYLFGVFLIFAGLKLFYAQDNKKEYNKNMLFKLFRKYISPRSKYYVFSIIVLIDLADIVFAVDSVPAVFAITLNNFIVFTSNIFAVMGLRSLYFVLEKGLVKFIYLQHALALVLIFIGAKIFIGIPSWVALVVTLLLLSGGVILSLRKSSHG